jgi:uncharacterized protein (UPF0262 family)
MEAHLLTEEQAQSLIGVEFIADNYFNPIEDADGNYVISIEEVEQTSIEWVKSLPLIEYKPIITPEI